MRKFEHTNGIRGLAVESSDIPATGVGRMKRVVIIADNSLIVATINLGLRQSGQFSVVGHADPRKTSATTILGARPDAVLIDDMDRSERVIELVGELKAEDASLAIVVLSVEMDQAWLARIFTAGATGAISKSTNPNAVATLLRATLNGHIFHRLSFERSVNGHESADLMSGEDLPLTRRELEILQLVAAGSTNGDVARKLWVTEQTVKFHLRNIYRKLDVANRTEASHFAHVNGLVSAQQALSMAS